MLGKFIKKRSEQLNHALVIGIGDKKTIRTADISRTNQNPV